MSIDDADDNAPARKKKRGGGLTLKQIKRRLDRIATMTDAKKAKSAHRRLSSAVLAAIAEGTIGDPRKVASIVVASSNEARATARAAKGVAREMDDESSE